MKDLRLSYIVHFSYKTDVYVLKFTFVYFLGQCQLPAIEVQMKCFLLRNWKKQQKIKKIAVYHFLISLLILEL